MIYLGGELSKAELDAINHFQQHFISSQPDPELDSLSDSQLLAIVILLADN